MLCKDIYSLQVRADRRDRTHGHGGRRPLLFLHPRPGARAPRPLAALQRRRGQALRPGAHRGRVLRRRDDGDFVNDAPSTGRETALMRLDLVKKSSSHSNELAHRF